MNVIVERIILMLRDRAGFDFSSYKPSMLSSRIESRMRSARVESLAEYERVLVRDPIEHLILSKEMLIGVTSFFRDPEAFDALARKCIPELVERARGEGIVRIWVPGCATGEEAYSLAILLSEGLEGLKRRVFFQVFGTDLDSDAIQVARRGRYSCGAVSGVDPDRLARFFVETRSGYRVSKRLREQMIFATHDLIEDKPITNLDLIVCRNVLIYLEPDLQEYVVAMFHAALRSHGALFIGQSETIGVGNPRFAPIDRRWKIYRRKELRTQAERRTTPWMRRFRST